MSEKAKYVIWWTGTLGHAEWLQAHSIQLRGNSTLEKCPKNLSGLPISLRPLFALEQPDLVVAESDGGPLLSIELTEQQEFGTNAQQRIARFWSAVANRVPSAYLLPIESYQSERASQSDRQILKEQDLARRRLLSLAATLPEVRPTSLKQLGISNEDELWSAARQARLGLSQSDQRKLNWYLEKIVDRFGPIQHLNHIDPDEFLHQVGSEVYKTYLRTPKVTSSMVLSLMDRCSEVVDTFPFKLQSDYSQLFRTNGLPHTMSDEENPHLSYRNLPPSPGTTQVVNERTGKDEITLFFTFVDRVISGSKTEDLGRGMFVDEGEYFLPEVREKWRKVDASETDVLQSVSADFLCSSIEFKKILKTLGVALTEPEISRIDRLDRYHIQRIQCGAARRSLADPYSGTLAVRDLLFCRDAAQMENLTTFDRSCGLVFFVEMTGAAATEHDFVFGSLNRQFQKRFPKLEASPQEQLIELSSSLRVEELSKDIRTHVTLCDHIIVTRNSKSRRPTEHLFGIAHLAREGLLPSGNKLVRSLAG